MPTDSAALACASDSAAISHQDEPAARPHEGPHVGRMIADLKKSLASMIAAGLLLTACGTQSAPSAAQLRATALSQWKAVSGAAYLANAKALVGDVAHFKADATAGRPIEALGDCGHLGIDVRVGRKLTSPPIAAAARRFNEAYAALETGSKDCISFLTVHAVKMGPRAGAAITRGLDLYLSAVNSLPAL